ncbi:MFS transporter [Streptomyces antnestii]|uniref:Putative proline/betaine transporter n=1 Tax=Streptomyces antnestii TaxID=2494256 RepID=A0A3S2YWC5_9ACTN|nr:MFS transporter [Streptomyces sp. San01]RVU20832.1 MFS transporter [Streptomyces sp. San01]
MAATTPQTDRRYAWKVAASSFLGNTLEYYDFLVYGTAAAVIFPKVFFPGEEGFLGTLAAFGTFAVGFLARPLGGLAFGRRGDVHGRKSTLLLTLSLMGLSTIAIGLLPGYDTIGVLAPALLVLLRLVQGFAVGGEWGGSMIIVLESAPDHRRGFYTAWPNIGGFSAQILITGLFAWVYTLPEDALYAWGWRIPFLLSAIILAVTFWLRRSLHESPVFTETSGRPAEATSRPETPKRAGGPIRAIFLEDWRNLLLIVGLRFAEALPYFLLTVFALSYASGSLGLDKSTLNMAVLIVSVLAFPAHGLYAALSDRKGRRPVYLLGAIVVAVAAFPFFWLLQSGNFLLIVLGYVLVLNLGHNAINAVQPAFFAELFPADRRYTGAAAGREIASILTGGLTPFIATALAGPDGTRWPLVAGYVVLGAVITMVAVWKSPETFRRDLRSTGAGSSAAASGAHAGQC